MLFATTVKLVTIQANNPIYQGLLAPPAPKELQIQMDCALEFIFLYELKNIINSPFQNFLGGYAQYIKLFRAFSNGTVKKVQNIKFHKLVKYFGKFLKKFSVTQSEQVEFSIEKNLARWNILLFLTSRTVSHSLSFSDLMIYRSIFIYVSPSLKCYASAVTDSTVKWGNFRHVG